MIRFPNAKINLGLRIVARRPDGYHNIETVFYPIQLQECFGDCSNVATGDEVVFIGNGHRR